MMRRRQALAALALPAVARGARPTLRVACAVPAGRLYPLTVADQGGLLLLAQSGEFLTRVGPDNRLRPMLATDWQSDAAARVWRFRLRSGVRFHDGAMLTASDVVATMDRLCDPARPSNALSVFRGVLSPGRTRALDAATVEFTLDGPDGNFPYAVSSDNYNAVILPARDGSGAIGTGPFRLRDYQPALGARFVANDSWWGGAVRPASLEFLFFADQAPQLLALRAGEADIVAQFVVRGAGDLIDDPSVRVLRQPSSAHRQIHLRNDRPPFADRRLRQALAAALDRAGLVQGLLRGLATVAADSPCAPVQQDVAAVAPRPFDPAAARRLAAGTRAEAAIVAPRLQEIPDLAVVVQQAAAAIGLALAPRVEETARYYGSAQPGSSDWLDSSIGITDYGHRAVPDVILRAALGQGGPWNAARFANPAFEAALADYRTAASSAARRPAMLAMQQVLAREVPVIVPYFFDYLVAAAPWVRGIEVSAIGQLFLAGAA